MRATAPARSPPSLRTTMPPFPSDVQWFPAEIRRLIVAIKKHEALYNPRHDGFGLRDSQTKSWKAVATLVGGGKTDIQCRDKWNCLRGTYRRHVRTEATNNVKRRSGWPWAEMMSFIKRYVIEKDDLPDPTSTKTVSRSSPVSQVKTHTPLMPKVSNGSGGLTLASGLYTSGGIIFNTNRMGIGLVQPKQTCILQTGPGPTMGLVQPGVTLGIVQPTQTTSEARTQDPIHVDLSKVKAERESGETPAPATTEFVDMDRAVKKEPVDHEEMDLPEEFDFLPEESTQGSREEDRTSRLSPPREPEEDDDSNQLFMRSTVAHMRRLSPYDQSVFKLRVQQLLHDMMFPATVLKASATASQLH